MSIRMVRFDPPPPAAFDWLVHMPLAVTVVAAPFEGLGIEKCI